MTDPGRAGFVSPPLERAAVEIEEFVGQSGWDQRPCLFALVASERFAAEDPEAAARMGLADAPPGTLTPIEQEPLPDDQLDRALAGVSWPDAVDGCALSQEIVILPPSAEAALGAEHEDGDGDAATVAANHPERREGRLVVAVERGGHSFALLRLRAAAGTTAAESSEELVTGADLAPNLVNALLATFVED